MFKLHDKQQKLFYFLDENIKSQVILGDRKFWNIKDKGIIAIKKKKLKMAMKNIFIMFFYVLNLAQNLLRVEQLV